MECGETTNVSIQTYFNYFDKMLIALNKRKSFMHPMLFANVDLKRKQYVFLFHGPIYTKYKKKIKVRERHAHYFFPDILYYNDTLNYFNNTRSTEHRC
jgi:hypothetical protein